MMHLGDLGWVADSLTRLTRPGGLDAFGAQENVWLVALGVGVLGPLLSLTVPRLARALGVTTAVGAMVLSFVATYRGATMLACGLITLAVAAAFVSSWSRREMRTSIGPRRPGPLPTRRVVRGMVLTGVDARAFDHLAGRRA